MGDVFLYMDFAFHRDQQGEWKRVPAMMGSGKDAALLVDALEEEGTAEHSQHHAGEVDSLNVSAAAALLMQRLLAS